MEIQNFNLSNLDRIKVNRTNQSFKASTKDKDIEEDSFKPSSKKSELTQKEKNEILHKSKVTASGWSIFTGILSTLYFALRSDKSIAKKYDLDTKKDKDFIEDIRKKQTIATLPGVFGLGILGWIYFKVIEDKNDPAV